MAKSQHSIRVDQITAAQTIAIRHRVLRQGKPIETCHFKGDDLLTTVHLGLFANDKLIGIATYLDHSRLEKINEVQLRGMAILPEWQGKSLGSYLIKTGEEIAINRKKEMLWCNVRISSQKFYQKMNFQTQGDIFTIPDVGPHIVMEKQLVR